MKKEMAGNMKYYIDDLNGRYNFRQTGIFYEWHPIHAAFSRLFCFALWVGGVALFDRFLDFLLSHANIILTILYKKMFVLVAAVILAFLAIALYRVSGGKAKFHYFADDIALIITGKRKEHIINTAMYHMLPLCRYAFGAGNSDLLLQ